MTLKSSSSFMELVLGLTDTSLVTEPCNSQADPISTSKGTWPGGHGHV